MSMIEKMSIMGIRSFGPDDSNQQVIQFQHPLTLLVGPNGAGKTTIIECLKYATTGEHPSNTKGGAFVHDPKLAHENEVRAKVRLMCRTIYGHRITVERSMSVVQKAKTVQFKTLDGVITKIRNDEPVQITSKCAELNREMVSALGVSKAVLDNVIFCHQEESNWPLSEGKNVKQKFDDIFAATRYIKALDEIRKIQKDQKNEKGKEDVVLPYLQRHSERAEELKNNLQIAETKLEAVKQSNGEITDQLSPVENRLRILSKKEAEIGKLSGKLENLKTKKDQMIEYRGKLESRIENKFYGTDEQLEEIRQNQDQTLESKRQKKLQCENCIEPLEREIKIFQEKKTDLYVKEGNLSQRIKNAENLKRNRTSLIQRLSSECGIHLSTTTPEDQVEEFEKSFKVFTENEMKQLKNQSAELGKEKIKTEQEYQNALQAQTRVSEGCKHKQDTLNDLREKVKKTTRELRRIQSAADGAQLDVLQQQLTSAQNDLQRCEDSTNISQMRNALEKFGANKKQLERDIEALDDKLIKMQKFAETRTKIDMLEKDKINKDESIRKLKSKNKQSLAKVGLASASSFPDQRKLSQWIKEKEAEIKSTQGLFDSEKSKLTKLKTQQEMITKQLEEKKNRFEELDNNLFEICGSQDIDHELTVIEADINKLRGKKGLTDGIQHMYKKFIAEMNTDDVSDKGEIPCPLCQRLFDEPSEVDELISILKEKLVCAPKKLEKQAEELEKKQIRFKVLQDSKPTKQELNRLEKDIAELNKQKSNLTSTFSPIKYQTETLESELSQMREEESLVKRCLPDVSQIDTLTVDIKDLSRQIQNLENELPVTSSSSSIDELNAEKRTMSFDLKKVSQSIDERRKEMEKHSDSINRLREKVNSIQAEKLELTADLQKCEQLQENQESLNAEIKRITSEIQRGQEELDPLSRKVEELKIRKEEITRKCERIIEEMNHQRQTLQTKHDKVTRYNNEIQAFEESGVNEKLERTKKQIAEITENIETSTSRLKQLRDVVKKLESDLVKCKERQRDLEDNAALRDCSREIDDVARQIEEVKKELGGMDVDELSREQSELSRKHDQLKKEQVRNKEREFHVAQEVENLKKDLLCDEIKFADQNYLKCLVNSTTLQLASEDLGKYYKALDRAVMRFHHIKMSEINKIIKDLWQETYRGKDIDYIEICSNEDTGASSRRVFNYRVVMYSGGVAMDMRGRCSAGQKVLASLVIRLALAETFCINCGVLALDEPTTNLDRDNIESLAKALVSIIESRSQQRNFQLVVITHDEDFVDLLGRSNYVDHFFRINKDDRARSTITKCPIKDLES